MTDQQNENAALFRKNLPTEIRLKNINLFIYYFRLFLLMMLKNTMFMQIKIQNIYFIVSTTTFKLMEAREEK